MKNWKKSRYGRALRIAAEEAFQSDVIDTQMFENDYDEYSNIMSRDEFKENWIIERMEQWFNGENS